MKITAYKYDPSVDTEPYYVEGEVEWREKMTAMEALFELSAEVAHVNCDWSCATRLCGRCAMLLNGEPCLICVAPLEDKDYTFEPLPGHPVIRDLIVDKKPLYNELSGIYDRIRIEPYTLETYEPAVYDHTNNSKLYGAEFCCRCGSCNAACPSLTMYPNEYIGPAGMIAESYRYFDQLDQGDRIMEAVSNGLYRCIQCGKCDEVCEQQDIHHLETWTVLREAAAARGIVPSYAQ